MKKQRFLNVGQNIVNGYEVNVVSFDSAKKLTDTSRVAAKYYGTISKDGELIAEFTEKGKTAKQIKVTCGVVEAATRTPSKLSLLNKTKQQLQDLGFATDEIDAAIVEENERLATIAKEQEAAKEARLAARAERAKQKLLNSKDFKLLKKAKQQLEFLGLSTAEVDTKMAALLKSIE